jgi:hypothetical protein
MTHIEIKKYFDKQRGIAMNPQTVQLPPDIGDIAKTVFWEKNQYVLHNPKIEPSQIIAKTSTHKFPAGATTIRFNSIKDRIATAYVYGKGKTQTHNAFRINQHTYIAYGSKLTVTFPNRNASNGRRDWGYTYNGDLPSDMARQDLDITLDYCEEVMKDFLNL